jgi:pyruvate formate lyase activating enzyme
MSVCKVDALTSTEEGIFVDRDKCTACGACVSICPTFSIELVGSSLGVEEVFEEVSKDILFYRQSGGGVTVSGGEALMNADFTIELFKLCKENYIHTALETTGFGSFEKLKELSEYTDLFLFDLKHSDSDIHKKLTQIDNLLILENFKKLSELQKEIILRMPLITGLNDNEDNIKKTIEIAKANSIRELHILPYHTLGLDKYKRLQKDYKFKSLEKHQLSYLENLKALVEASGIKCIIGG